MATLAEQSDKERKKAEKAKKFAEKRAKTSVTPTLSNTQLKRNTQEPSEDTLPEIEWRIGSGLKKELGPFHDEAYKAYNPRIVESDWYAWWEKSGFFEPKFGPDGKVKAKGYFVIPEPPPNVTGSLHMGHALPNALQDTMIRWNRMRGFTTLWLPGCDHASISTQSVVEKMIMKQEGKTRHDLSRDKLVERIWEWKEKYHGNINAALRRMGGSFDWSREAFTMNPTFVAAVTETFCTLHEEGYIYRSNKLVNWCTALNTSLSNLEVDNIEIKGLTMLDVPGYKNKIEFGVLTYFLYHIEGSDETIEVATTRPETILGDTGIAVNPGDKRYSHLVGKYATHPFIKRRLPIFTDDYVDVNFGSGAVKMTPAHDHNDFEIGKKHKLDFINIFNDDGTMNHNTGEFQGVQRFDARTKVIDALKEKGLYRDWAPNDMNVPICQKTKDIIEPIMKPQWWMKMKGGLAEAAIEVVKDKKIIIRPEKSEREYFRWMENINDWCLSRQLWWGHQPPAYLVHIEGEPKDDADGDDERWVTGRTLQAAEEKAKAKFPGKKLSLTQDPDVLDTWFSAGLWPFATLGWPEKTPDYEKLYPTSMLETGWDILFFWVARMIMLGVKMTGQVPFKEVYCHSLVRDSEGRKMSKSLGNVIDPLDVASGISLQALHDKLQSGNLDPKELQIAKKSQSTSFPSGIPECGTDALRFSLINYTTGAGDIAFDVKQMYGYRKFCNKIYQATKFVHGKIGLSFNPQAHATKADRSFLADRWILHKFSTATAEINLALTAREFSQATRIVYEYWYNHLCDVYIENSKSIIQEGTPEEQESAKQTLYTALEGGLRMLHPFMPFVTEELWQRLPRRPGDTCPSIVLAAYPENDVELEDPASEEPYELILAVSKVVRSLAAEYSIKESAKVYIQLFNSEAYSTCKAQLQSIRTLIGKPMQGSDNPVLLTESDTRPKGCIAQAASADAACYLSVKGRIDVDAGIDKIRSRLAKANESLLKQQRIVGGLKKAGIGSQSSEIQKLEDTSREVAVLSNSLSGLQNLKHED